jgi:hypothetical protein
MHNTGDPTDTDSIPSNGETWLWKPLFRNIGTGTMANLRGSLTAISGGFVDTDTASFESTAEQASNVSMVHPFQFRVDDQANLKLSLAIYSTIQQPDTFFKRVIQFGRPVAPAFLADSSGAPLRLQTSKDAIVVVWQKSPSTDVQGYVLKRATAPNGTFLPVTGDLLTRMEYYRDQGLAGLTRYYYKISAVDLSGNQSQDSDVITSTTSPATLPGWPVALNDVGYGCPTIENIDKAQEVGHQHQDEIFLNTDVMYAFRSDGSEVIDGDQLSTTNGVWSTDGASFWGKPAIADINNDGVAEIVATCRKNVAGGTNGGHVFVWDATGRLLWQANAGSANLLCSPVIANIDADTNLSEILVQNDGAIYAWNHDGSPVIPANANGMLLQVENDSFTYGSLAVADLDGDGKDEIIYAYAPNGSGPSKLSVVKFNGTSASILSTVTIDAAGPCNSSPSVLRAADGTYEIFVDARSHIVAYKWVQASSSLQSMWSVQNGGLPGGASRPYDATVAIGNVTGTAGEYDIVAAGGSGKVYALNAQTGNSLLGFPLRLGSSAAKLSSPLLVDMDNDTTTAEIVIGDDGGTVYAIKGTSGHAGELLPGFPYATGGSIVNGLAYWDVDYDKHPELLIQANALPTVTSLQLSNVNFPKYLPGRMSADPWTSFRHDTRNTGRFDADVVTPVATMEAEGSSEAGVAVIRWDASLEPETFRVQRSGLDGEWTTRQEGPTSLFRQAQAQGYEYRDPSDPGSYSYRVIGFDGAGSTVLQSQEVHVTVLPVRLRLIGAVPNPFNPRTMIRYESPEGKIQLDVIDLSGRLVRTLFNGAVQPGRHDVEWDGRNNAGHDVGSGIYLARLRGTGGMRSQKIVLLR